MALSKRTIPSCGLELPTLGFGGAPLGGLFNAVDNDEANATLIAAYENGMTYVDTAPLYGFGKSEHHVGRMLLGRDYTLSTKVGRLLRPGAMPPPGNPDWPAPLPFTPVFNYGYDAIMRSFEDSLQRLGLDRIDILYVHDIDNYTHGDDNIRHISDLREGGLRAMDELRSSGAVKAIGLGVNDTQTCRTALTIGDWDVFLLAGRYTLLEQHPLEDLLPECEASNTSLVIGGAFNSGILAGGDTFNYSAVPDDVRTKVEAIKQVCSAHNVPLAAAALQFPLGHPLVVSVLPGLRSRAELRATLDWIAIDIPAAFWDDLKERDLLRADAPVPDTNPYMAPE